MNVLRDRPRMAVAFGAAVVALVVLSMLAGGALAGDDDCPSTGTGAAPPRTQL
ncbi:MAG: hypothetical protein ACRDLN_04730 [Solirubrobacteraceae bacterium]